MPTDQKQSQHRFPWVGVGLLVFVYSWLTRGREFQGVSDFIMRSCGLIFPIALGVFIMRFVGWKWAWPLGAGAVVFCFEYWVGAYSLLRDVLVMLICAALSVVTSSRTRMMIKRPAGFVTLPGRSLALLATRFLLLAWVAVYFADWISFNERNPVVAKRQFSTTNSAVTIALSGGGYRAALYHAGVLSALEHYQVRPKGLATVSGGSIIGAFYANGGSPDDFLKLVSDGRFNVKRELLAPWNLIRLVLTARVPGTDKGFLPCDDFTRTFVQAAMLDRLLLHGVTMDKLKADNSPELLVCSTDLITGSMVGVHRGGAIIHQRLPAAARESFVNSVVRHDGLGDEKLLYLDWCYKDEVLKDRPLSLFVAASGAFPGAFAPLRLVGNTPRTFVLADGGIADNLGWVLLNDVTLLSRKSTPSLPEEFEKWIDPKFGLLNKTFWDAVKEWNVRGTIISDGSSLTIDRVPKKGLMELGAAMDAIYRSSGSTAQPKSKGSLAGPISAVLLSPAVFLTKDFAPYTTAKVGEAYHWDSFPFYYRASPGSYLTNSPQNVPIHDRRKRSIPPNYSQLELDDLAFLVACLPPSTRMKAQKLLASAASLREIEIQRNLGKRYDRPHLGIEGGAARNEWDRALEGDMELYEILSNELVADFVAFSEASTLKDSFPKDKAAAIFRLGQFMARFNRSYVEELLATRPPDTIQ